ncbi:smad nuclear-interacting protein 1-like [Oppia nitens]|uniref:smad nuclear-interacting protein 1-like n=1 Tax=Oppia nitens TaxID=1686743 RepID=UPI0023DA8F7D|nr:smad nuclear-interacting protein 1-like [Oppia nitens]
MSSRRSDSRDRDRDKYDRRRTKDHHNRDRSPKDRQLAYNELRHRAIGEQRGRRHDDQQQPRHDNRYHNNRDYRRHDEHRNSDNNYRGDNNRRRDRDTHTRRHNDFDGKDRNNGEFWSKEAKSKTRGHNNDEEEEEPKEKEKPNLQTTGKLAEDTNMYNGVVIKYNQPPEARKPKRRWRLYPFKGDDSLEFIPIHRQSAYLMGRDRKVADIPIDHPSCSKQHSVVQFRLMEYKKDDDTISKRVRPYIIDLESANGTFVNNQKIEPKRYYELFEKDVIKFGFSTREYVVLHEQSVDESDDDDIAAEVEIKDEPKD